MPISATSGIIEAMKGRSRAELLPGTRMVNAMLREAELAVDLVDATGTIIASLGAEDGLLGRGRRIGESVLEHVHPEDIAETLEQIEGVLSRPHSRALFTVRANHLDGSWRLIEVMAVNRFEHPELGGVVVRTRLVGPADPAASSAP